MKSFNISRISTKLGTFRVSGQRCCDKGAKLKVESIEVMGTDGWVLLDHTSERVMVLIDDLTPELQAHLRVKSLHT